MNPVIEQLAHRIAAALFNGLYQGLILAAVLWVGLRLCRGVNAATRHAVSFVALLLVAALPILHFIWPANTDHATARTAPNTATVQEPMKDTENSVQAVLAPPTSVQFAQPPEEIQLSDVPLPPSSNLPEEFEAITDADRGAPGNNAEPADSILPPSPVAELSEHRDVFKVLDPIPAPLQTDHWPAAETTRDTTAANTRPATLFSQIAKPIQTWRAIVPGYISALAVGVLILISGFRLGRLGLQLFALRRLKKESAPPHDELADLFDNLICESQINRTVRLLVSEEITTPMAIGYLRPVVLLPAELIATADHRGLASVLRHELAHVQRNDDWINLAQQAIHATLFFHPAVWWLSRRLTIDREIACDDHALSRLESRHDYALFLTEFAGRSRGHDWIAAPAAWCSSSHLKERINMILDNKRNTSLRLARKSAGLITLATVATTAAALIAGPRLVFAESPDSAPASSASATSNDEATSTTTSSAAVNWNSDQEPIHSTSASVVTRTEPVRVHTHAVVTLRNGDDALVSPIKVKPPVNTDIQIVDARPHTMIAQSLTAAVPDEPLPPKGPKPPSAGDLKPVPPPEALTAPRTDYRESLERRIDRLERMIDRLTDERREVQLEFSPDELKAKDFAFTDKDKVKWKDKDFTKDSNWPMSEEQQREIQKSMAKAQEEIARAMKEVDLKTREAAVNAREQAKRTQQKIAKNAEVDSQRKVIELQKEALERQMEDLGRQMEKLDRQMEQLDDHLDRLDDQIDEHDNETETRNLTEPPQPEPKHKEKR
ncbi:hypothetical protein GC207_06275 [bacterium]|nr:hypothetical protein [bacterium]